MSYVTSEPETLAAAAAGALQGIGWTMSAQSAAPAVPTVGVAADMHAHSATTLQASAGSYAAIKVANAAAPI